MARQPARNTLRLAIALATPLWLLALALLPLLSAPFPALAQSALHIEEDGRLAREIFAYTRRGAFSRASLSPPAGLSERAHSHLRDVSALLRGVFLAAGSSGIALALATAGLRARENLLAGLRAGAWLALALVLLAAVLSISGWQGAFVAFHRLFFAEGSWQFHPLSALIRNFPPRFWAFSAALLGMEIVLMAGALLLVSRDKRGRAGNMESTAGQR